MKISNLFYQILVLLISILIVAACEDNPAGSDDPPSDGDNEAPTAVADASSETVEIDEKVTLDASESSDPDGDDLTYEWDLTTPEGSSAELSDDQAEDPTFTPDEAGDYIAELTVDDGNGETDRDEVTVTAESEVVEINDDITEDDTWTDEARYRVTDAIDIQSGATLTVEAGVTVEFEQNAGLRVETDDAALVAEGTETDSVTFTGVEEQAGYWLGLAYESNNASNKLEYAVVEYGGSESWPYIDEAANVALREGPNREDAGGRVEITHSRISHSGDFGLFASTNADLSDFSDNTLTDNEVAAAITTASMGALDSGSTYSGNAKDYVLVKEQNVMGDMTVSLLDVPYRVEGEPDLENDAQVTIEAGVTVEFASNAGLRVDSDNAALIASGTEEEPVTFTGAEEEPGFWRGISFDSNNAGNELDYAVIEYGGSENWAYIDEAANVSLREGARLTLTNSTIRESDSYGGWGNNGTDTDISYNGNSYSNNPDGDNNYGDKEQSNSMELSEAGWEKFDAGDESSAEELVGIVGEHGILTIEGEEPREIRWAIFITGDDGEIEGEYFSEPVTLEPGEHRVDESLSVEEVAEAIQHYFPDSVYFPDSLFFPDSVFFPDDIFSPRSLYFPDSFFDEMELSADQAGIMIAPVGYDSGQELANDDIPVDPIILAATPQQN